MILLMLKQYWLTPAQVNKEILNIQHNFHKMEGSDYELSLKLKF